MLPAWFRPRGYRHFDVPVGESFAKKALSAAFVEQHGWSPLISYVKRQKRYKPKLKKTIFKDRPIMFASHRDACILSRYAADISRLLDEAYDAHGSAQFLILREAIREGIRLQADCPAGAATRTHGRTDFGGHEFLTNKATRTAP